MPNVIRITNLRRRTIYTDLVGLPDPCYLGLSIEFQNVSGPRRDFYVDASAPHWKFTRTFLGGASSPFSYRFDVENFGYRDKPSSERSETITITLEAGGDGYGGPWSLEATDIGEIGIHFVDSEDGSWTVDEDDDFDDNTKQGWTHSGGADRSSWIVTEQAMSGPYSLRGTLYHYPFGPANWQYPALQLYKAFNTADRNFILAIACLRVRNQAGTGSIYLRDLSFEDVELGYEPADATTGRAPPADQWMKAVAFLPKNTAVTINPRATFRIMGNTDGWGHLYLDDFKIISRG